MSSERKKYMGRVVTHEREKGYGFIGIRSITRDDGTEHDLVTTSDVFIHRDDCGEDDLRVGMTVSFEVIPDHKRGDGYFRAQGAVNVVEAELIPDDDPLVRHFSKLQIFVGGDDTKQASPLAHPLPPHPWQGRAKKVPAEVVEKTLENDPLPNANRDESGITNPRDPQIVAALETFLHREFPQMTGLELGYDVVNVNEAAFDAKVAEATADLRDMGMGAQATLVEQEVARFRGTRKVLAYMFERELIRPNTFIATRYLPDIFMAVPVWYFATEADEQRPEDHDRRQTADPRTHPRTIAICDILPGNIRWADTYQMFNRRMRPLSLYTGDIIPVPILRLIREAKQHFDHVVIATPYHDIAGADWDDLTWIRSIDPYVLGFQNGCSHFFVLGRFSDSGVFPLYHELVADATEFLRKNRERLRGFNAAENPYWYVGMKHGTNSCHGNRGGEAANMRLGNHLIAHTEELLRAFDAGHLFDWLREEWSLPDETPAPTPPAT